MKFNKTLFYFLIIFAFNYLKAQELPPIQKYTPENYAGENQNWMISQATNKFIYVANNEGLLEFNGASWKMYTSPNNTILRAVKVVKNRIYTGCYMEFGYWQKNTLGNLQYTSLIPKLKEKLIEDEHFWNIISYEEWVLFQSYYRIYFYNTESGNFTYINSKNTITKVFNLNNTIYYNVENEGIYKIDEGKPKLILNINDLKNAKVINIFSKDSELLIQTRNSGFYTFKNNNINLWNISSNKVLKTVNVYSSIQLKDKSFVLGTISNGIIFLNAKGNIESRINQQHGLSNNTALSLFEDYDENIWVGLDNGINCVNIKSPIRIFKDDIGRLGTVYTSTIFKNNLYLGTNQGLFYKRIGKDNSFQFVKGTDGQVWSLYVFNNELFCGHHSGSFLIKNGQANLIVNKPGTWNFKPFPNKKNELLQGNYNGLNVLIKKNGKWQFKNKIKGFENSVRYFEITDYNEIFISHGYKGVFKLKVDKDFKYVININKKNELKLGKSSSLVKYKNNIFYSFNEGVYKYNRIQDLFLRDSILSAIITTDGGYLSGKLIIDKQQNLWAFSKENINKVSINNLTRKYRINQFSFPVNFRKGAIGYENISQIKKDSYLIGTANGYLKIDFSKINVKQKNTVFLNSITLKKIKSKQIPVNKTQKGEFKYNSNSIHFEYSVPNYNKYQIVKYQYKLNGNYNNWSDWSYHSEITFENLPFGNYTFKIRAKVGNKLTSNVEVYNFTILRPWYLSSVFIIIYAVLFLVLVLVIHSFYKRHYTKQKQKLLNKTQQEFTLTQLESDKLIMKLKNEKLQNVIESKTKELSMSTMNIIKKNEVLSKIKIELLAANNKSDINSVIKTINNNLNKSSDWQIFVKAFNDADSDFLKKIKSLHPKLTPNDLRLCAYLRLNLSTKEIAPLLNISIRSVEIKRYRLRKKMDLEHNSRLVEYILGI